MKGRASFFFFFNTSNIFSYCYENDLCFCHSRRILMSGMNRTWEDWQHNKFDPDQTSFKSLHEFKGRRGGGSIYCQPWLQKRCVMPSVWCSKKKKERKSNCGPVSGCHEKDNVGYLSLRVLERVMSRTLQKCS